MIPEPQMPVIPIFLMLSSNSISSDQYSEPMTLNLGSKFSGLILTLSMAPGAARCPELICAPSKAGPVGLEAASNLS